MEVGVIELFGGVGVGGGGGGKMNMMGEFDLLGFEVLMRWRMVR